MRDVAFGQYYPGASPVHRLDPRTKLLIAIVYIVAIFLSSTYWAYLTCFLFLLVAIIVSQVPLKSILKSVKAILFVVLVTVLINVFFHDEGKVLFSWWKITITDDGLIFASKMAMRLVFLVISTSLVTLTTTPVSLTDGMESLLRPLKVIRFPVHDMAVIMSIALRFIPSFTEEIDKIMMAQKARGASFDHGNIFKRARSLLPVLIPLFVSAFRRADELALAMDARCYNATEKRTKMKVLKFRLSDLVAFLFSAVFLAVIIMLKCGFFGLV